MPTSPLHPLAGDAPLVEVDAVSVAAHFGDPLEEARQARRGAALSDRSHRARLEVQGKDAISFLQGQTTNDVAVLKLHQGCYAAVLIGKGRMRGDLRLCRLPDAMFVDAEGSLRESLVEHLDRYIIMEDVSFEDRSESLAALAVVGPRSGSLLQDVLGVDVPALPEAHGLRHDEILLLGEPCTGMAGTMAVGYAERLLRLGQELLEAGAGRLGAEGFEALRVEAGWPRWGYDLDQETLPPEANLEQRALSYNKGCYTGQETMARIRTYGHVNRQLVGLLPEGEGVPARGADVESEGKRVGSLTSVAASPMLARPVALAMLRREVAEVGTRVEIVEGETRRPALVASLPFWREG